MFGKIRRSVAVILSVCLISASFAVLPPAKARADQSVPDFSYITGGYYNGTQVFTAAQAREVAKRCYIGLRDNVNIPLGGTGLTGNSLSVTGFDDETIFYAGTNILAEVAQNCEVGLLWTGKTSGTYDYSASAYALVPEYVEVSDRDAAFADYSAQYDEMLSGVDPNWTDAEKALYIHDYIAVNFDYDHDYSVYKVYGFLQSAHVGVCDAYSSLYSYLLHRLGIEALKGVSDPDQNKHAWNLVKIGGSWYYVDVTHDDPKDGFPGYVDHDYFLRSTSGILQARTTNSQWKTEDESAWHLYTGQCVDTLGISASDYSGIWTGVEAAIPPYDGGWVTIESPQQGTINVVLNKNGTASTLKTHSGATWYAAGSSTSYYPGCFSAATAYDGVLFYTTPYEIYGCYNGSSAAVYTMTSSEKSGGPIYGIKASGDRLYYYTAATPNDSAQEHSISLEDAVDALKPERTVTFISDGEVYRTDTVNKGQTVAKPTDPTKTYSDFGGWYTDDSFTTLYDFGTAVTKNITLYAKWTPQTANVTFISSGEVYDTTTVNKGQTVARPADPQGDEYEDFGGWYTDEECENEYNFDDAVTDELDLYAKWTHQTANVTFISNSEIYDTVTVNKGETVAKPADPQSEGYFDFVGWYSDDDNDNAYNFETPVLTDLTLTAKWNKQTAQVTFMSNGEVYSSEELEKGDTVNEPTAPEARQFELFGGWYGEEECVNEFDFGAPVTADSIVYAKWIECRPVSQTATLSDIIKFNLQMKLSDEIINDDTAVITFSFDGVEVQSFSMSGAAPVTGEDGLYEFFVSVPTSKMDAVVTAVAETRFGSVSIEGGENNKSVNAYLKAAVGVDPDVQKVVESALIYGGFANAYFDDDKSTLPDESAAAVIDNIEITEPTAGDYTAAKSGTLPEGLTYEGSTLLLKGATAVRHYFRIDDPNELSSYDFSLTDNNSGYTCEVSVKESMPGENLIYVEIGGISPQLLSSKFTLRAEKDGAVFNIGYSPCCYIYSMVNRSKDDPQQASFVKLMKAMYSYYQTTRDYLSEN